MENKILLKGGVLIIGSLLWDDKSHRVTWRKENLKENEKHFVKAPIRYGRVSNSRNCTHTMVFSKNCDNEKMIGQGVFLPFQNHLDSDELFVQATRLKVAEHPEPDKVDRKYFNWGWGCIGILLNPKITLADEKKNDIDAILLKWKAKYSSGFSPNEYRVGDENPVLDVNGFLQINWPEGLDEFDFLVATATKPDKEYPEAKEISARMIINKYKEYFETNINNSISTFQDKEIQAELKKAV